MSSISPTLARAVVLVLPLVGAAHPARADVLDTSMPRTVAFGPPRGAAPSDRVDPRRTGRARARLPEAPVELWRRHVSGNIEVSPVVDEAGNIIVALHGSSEVVKLAPDARELWRFRMGGGNVVAAPALLNDGTITVVTTTGSAWGLTPSGALRFLTPLGVMRRELDTPPALLALSEGGLLVAAGSTLVVLDADGSVRARALLEDRAPGAAQATLERAAGALIEGPSGALVTTSSGNVYRFRPPAPPQKIGSLGGVATRGAMLADDRTLVAIVDGRRVVALDLLTGTAHVRGSGVALDAPPALSPSGLVVVSTQLGLLVGLDASGNEKLHATLDKASAPPAAATGVITSTPLPVVDLKPSPPVVIDPDGRLAFVRAGGRVGVLTGLEDPRRATPAKVIVTERVCAAPVALAPAGEKRFLVACRDGGLWMYGE